MQEPSPLSTPPGSEVGAAPSPAAMAECLAPGEPLSIYVHLPFCRERCPYCDFFVLVEPSGTDSNRLAPFIESLGRELSLALAAYPELRAAPAATLYLGGGTPSLFSPAILAPLLGAVRDAFDLAPDAEITLEANPTSFFAENLDGYIKLGVNRLSLGIQTLDADALRLLGRAHTVRQSLTALQAARTAAETGRLSSYSADLIFGYPGQTTADLEAYFGRLVEEYLVPHVSAYGLTLHEGTPYYRRHAEGRLDLPPDETVNEMFRALRALGRRLGLPPYEISNFAHSAHESRHNTAYWTLAPVVALGPSACGYLAGRRVENPRSLEEWSASIDAGRLPWRWEEPLEGRRRAGELLMCALRRTKGASWDWLARRLGDTYAGPSIPELYGAEFADAEQRGWLARDTDGLRLTEAGVLWSDEFFATLF